ncbi:MAG: AAA family ATPase [Agathobacter sp.]
MMKKKMILVTSPPACGKTYISKQLAKRLKHVVYLDKDTLIPLTNRVFAAAGEEINRSSDFFKKNIRDYEYEVIVDLGLEALDYDDIVLINAPFTREIRSESFLADFQKKLSAKGAVLNVIWVVTDKEVCHQRMIARNSVRDTWKLEHWDEYIGTQDFSIPEPLKKLEGGHDLLLFYNSSDEEYQKSMADILPKLEMES